MPYVKVVRINIFLSDDQGVNSDHALRIEMVVNLTETNINLPIQIFIDETGNLRIKEALNNGWFSKKRHSLFGKGFWIT